MTVGDFFQALSDVSAGCDRSCVAYDGHGRLFVAGQDGLLRSVDVRRRLASSRVKLDEFQPAGGSSSVRLLKPVPALDFSPQQLSINRGGQFALLAGPAKSDSSRYALAAVDVSSASEKGAAGREAVQSVPIAADLFAQRPGLKVLHAAWHPHSDHHFGLLTSDNIWRIFSTHRPEYAEQTFELTSMQQDTARSRSLGLPTSSKSESVTSFTFGSDANSWDRFSVYFSTSAGNLYLLCPVAPFGTRCPVALSASLLASCSQLEAEQGQTSESWLQQALGMNDLDASYMHVAPHALDHHSPALQGPLFVSSNLSPSAGSFDLGPVTSLAILHWEAGVRQKDHGGAAPSVAPVSCSAILTAGPHARLYASLLEGGVSPAWRPEQPKVWSDTIGNILATRSRVSSVASSSSTPRLSVLDEIPIKTDDDADDSGSDSSDDESDACEGVSLVNDPLAPDQVFAILRNGLVGISLPWLSVLAKFLAEDAVEGGGGALPSLPQTVAVDLTGEWGKDSITDGCVIGDSITGTKLALVKASGSGLLLPTWELSSEGNEEPVAGSVFKSLPSAQPPPLESSHAALKKAEAALESRYAWILAGPDQDIKVPTTSGSVCSDVQGQRDLHTAISQLHKKYIEYTTQAHQFIKQKVPALTTEAQRQSEQECDIRRQLDSVSTKKSVLDKRLLRAAQFNANLQKRLALLGMLSSSRPRPLSLQERALQESVPVYEENLKHWHAKMMSLNSRTNKAVTSVPKSHAPAFSLPHTQIQRVKAELETLSATIANNMANIEEAEIGFDGAMQ